MFQIQPVAQQRPCANVRIGECFVNCLQGLLWVWHLYLLLCLLLAHACLWRWRHLLAVPIAYAVGLHVFTLNSKLLTFLPLSCNTCFIANGISCSKFDHIFYHHISFQVSILTEHCRIFCIILTEHCRIQFFFLHMLWIFWNACIFLGYFENALIYSICFQEM